MDPIALISPSPPPHSGSANAGLSEPTLSDYAISINGSSSESNHECSNIKVAPHSNLIKT